MCSKSQFAPQNRVFVFAGNNEVKSNVESCFCTVDGLIVITEKAQA